MPLRRLVSAMLATSLMLFTGCLAAPKATVELAEIVDQQIAELRSSHEKFVRLYYKSLRSRAEDYLQQQWTPIFLGKALENPAFKAAFEATLQTARIDPDKVEVSVRDATLQPSDQEALLEAVREALAVRKGMLGEVMQGFADAARKEIQKKRQELMVPIDEQEGLVLDALRQSWSDLTGGTTALRGYLASVVNLTASRDAILQKVGLLNEQRAIVEFAADASDKAADLVAKGEKLDQVIEKLEDLTRNIRARVKNRQ